MTSNMMNNIRPFISFFLGASLATFLILFYLSPNTTTKEKEALDLLASKGGESTTIHEKLINETVVVGLTQEGGAYQDLVPLLERAAMDDKTVILTTVNEAFAAPNSLLDLFLESFRVGEGIKHLLGHLIVVAMDSKAFDRCTSVHPLCYFHKINGTDFTSEKAFMTQGYIEIVWSKIRLQRRILELGYNFLFTDVDILWFRDPRRHISVYADITTSCDRFFGNPDELGNWPNTGLFYVKSTEKSVGLLKYWDEARARFPPDHEQNVFNQIKGELAGRLGAKIRFIDTAFCGGFCAYGKDLNKICTMHSNCCVGLEKKLDDLRSILDDWKNYTSLSPDEKRKGLGTWTVPGKCIR